MGFCRNKPLRKILATWCAFATLATTSAPAFAALDIAFDQFNSVLHDRSANVDVTHTGAAADATVINVDLTSGAAGVLDWTKFNIPGDKNQTMNFGQTGSGAFYNIVSGPEASTIAGTLNASANAANNVWIFNPNGIAINGGSTINVGGIFGAIAAGATYTDTNGDGTGTPLALASVGDMVGTVTIHDGANITAAQNVFAGTQVTIGDTAGTATIAGDTTIAAGKTVTVFDYIGGGSVARPTRSTSWASSPTTSPSRQRTQPLPSRASSTSAPPVRAT